MNALSPFNQKYTEQYHAVVMAINKSGGKPSERAYNYLNSLPDLAQEIPQFLAKSEFGTEVANLYYEDYTVPITEADCISWDCYFDENDGYAIDNTFCNYLIAKTLLS